MLTTAEWLQEFLSPDGLSPHRYPKYRTDTDYEKKIQGLFGSGRVNEAGTHTLGSFVAR